MSIVFGAGGGQYLTGSANISIPNGDWCVAAFLNISNHSGTERNTIISAGAGTSSLELTFGTLRLQDPGGMAGSGLMRVYDGAGGEVLLRSTTLDVPVGSWFLLVGQRSGANRELWTTPVGGTPRMDATVASSIGAASFGTPMVVGRRRCTEATNDDCQNLSLAWVARGSFALSASQMTALANLRPPHRVAGWTEYLPFFAAGQSSHRAVIGGNTYTVSGYPTGGSQPGRLW